MYRDREDATKKGNLDILYKKIIKEIPKNRYVMCLDGKHVRTYKRLNPVVKKMFIPEIEDYYKDMKQKVDNKKCVIKNCTLSHMIDRYNHAQK